MKSREEEKEAKVIFTNGCFDILHRGHIELFQYARTLGDKLIVSIDSDTKVQCDKGPNRPINNFEERKFILESIEWVDEVHIFHNTVGLELLVKNINPDIMVVGSDWRGKPIVGSQYTKEVKYFDRIDGYSTTQIIKNIINR